jgi:peroxiredoxin
MITIGDNLPEATLTETTEFGEACPLSPKPVARRRRPRASASSCSVARRLPPTCSAKHVPGYVANLDALRARGVGRIWCVAVNDAYVMAAWGRDRDAIGKIRMLGDGNAELTKKLGLERDLTKDGMGIRSRRFRCWSKRRRQAGERRAARQVRGQQRRTMLTQLG